MQTITKAMQRLCMMAFQSSIYLQGFQGLDDMPFTAGMRSRLVKMSPAHTRGGVVSLLSYARTACGYCGPPVGTNGGYVRALPRQ